MGSDDLVRRVAEAVAWYNALSPAEKKAHDDAQRASWVRGMGPCEHGVYDFETCPDCRAHPTDKGEQQS